MKIRDEGRGRVGEAVSARRRRTTTVSTDAVRCRRRAAGGAVQWCASVCVRVYDVRRRAVLGSTCRNRAIRRAWGVSLAVAVGV